MSDEKMLGFYSGIAFVFLVIVLMIGLLLGGLFFNDQVNKCKDLGYNGIAGIDACEKTVNYQTEQGNVEVKQKIKLNTYTEEE
jgi:hypothetical protein